MSKFYDVTEFVNDERLTEKGKLALLKLGRVFRVEIHTAGGININNILIGYLDDKDINDRLDDLAIMNINNFFTNEELQKYYDDEEVDKFLEALEN